MLQKLIVINVYAKKVIIKNQQIQNNVFNAVCPA
jgi:hypothetical protein